MAKQNWGKVFYQNTFAGILREEPGYRYSFTYDSTYLSGEHPAISYTLPLQEAPFITHERLPAFFDNLVAEGWLEEAQSRLLGKRSASRFELLLSFGHDCAGAVSVIDPDAITLHLNRINQNAPAEVAVYRNRASLSGIQPKVLLTKKGRHYHTTVADELSTHIAKLPSHNLSNITYNEWLTLRACRALLPEDDFVEASFESIDGLADDILILKRFDRSKTGERIHFEEFNQLLNFAPHQKYSASYKDMADFLRDEKSCLNAEIYKLYKRIIVGLITGNTDMHLKNFAMFHTENGLRLAPNYDQVAAAIYKPYQYIALTLDRGTDRIITQLKPKNIIGLGNEFSLSKDAIAMAVNDIEIHLDAAKQAITDCDLSQSLLKNDLITFMEKRWNNSYKLIGTLLSKKP